MSNRARMFMVSDCGELLLIPATACRGCVARNKAHEQLWLTHGDVASSSESMHKLRTCGALQSGVALPIHTGDSVARLIQDTDTLNKPQCGATASRTQSRSCAPVLKKAGIQEDIAIFWTTEGPSRHQGFM